MISKADRRSVVSSLRSSLPAQSLAVVMTSFFFGLLKALLWSERLRAGIATLTFAAIVPALAAHPTGSLAYVNEDDSSQALNPLFLYFTFHHTPVSTLTEGSTA